MKLACTQENLQRGLSIVGRTVSRSSTLPVLGNVLLKTGQVYTVPESHALWVAAARTTSD